MTVDTIKVFEYEGRLFRTEKEVTNYRAAKALKEAYPPQSIYSNALYNICADPEKCYLMLKEFYFDS